jgi:hypothetical protein
MHQFKRNALIGTAAAGLLALAAATPAFAQATTYPRGTDCSTIENTTNRTACLNQMNQEPNSNQNQVTPLPGTNDTMQPGTGTNLPGAGTGNDNMAPSTGTGTGTDGMGTGTNGGAGTNGGTGTGGATQ